MFKTKKTVASITESLNKIKTDLKTLEEDNTDELHRLREKKHDLDRMIDVVLVEKEKGWKIFKNISNLLGEPVSE